MMDIKRNSLFKFQHLDLMESTAFSFGYWGLAFALANSVFSVQKHLYILLMTFGFVLICLLKILVRNKKRKS